VLVGREAVEGFGTTIHDSAPLMLIGFGFVYMIWALWRIFGRRIMHHADHLDGTAHAHGHVHGHHDHGGRALSEWGLFLLFCADPCIALIPMVIAASAGGWGSIGWVVLVYELATIAAIVLLVQTAHAGARAVRFPFLDRYGDVVAGAVIVTVGTLVTWLGI
jgi:threonine/homoserine/homoserine lactone efflux protein